MDITTRAVVRQLSRTAVDTKNHEDLASPFGGKATIVPASDYQRFAAKGVEPDLVALAVADHVLTFRGDGFGTVDVVACPRGPRFKAMISSEGARAPDAPRVVHKPSSAVAGSTAEEQRSVPAAQKLRLVRDCDSQHKTSGTVKERVDPARKPLRLLIPLRLTQKA